MASITNGRLTVDAIAKSSAVDRLNGDLVMMTSGSTGTPKGVALSLEKVLLNAVAAGSVMQVWRCAAWSIDIDMALMSALSHTLMAWQFDLPLHHLTGSSNKQTEQIFSERVGFGGSPIQLIRFSDRVRGGTSPEMLVSSGDFLMPAMVQQVCSDFPLTKVHKLYGLTELAGRFCCMTHELLMGNSGAAGRPLPGLSSTGASYRRISW